ncbi:MAG: hypothetical protein NTV94_05795 [Planctomycetota bacterium]|nr:hypothetical protein [Planctomycetota bacterium]
MSDASRQLPPDPVAQATARTAAMLTQLVRNGEADRAITELYAPDASHIEPFEFPGSPYKRITSGKNAILRKNEEWARTTQVHSIFVSTPRINGDQFTCEMKLEVTSTHGPMANQRMTIEETCIYTVHNGQITQARFFYGNA